jgi:hypothetical protein
MGCAIGFPFNTRTPDGRLPIRDGSFSISRHSRKGGIQPAALKRFFRALGSTKSRAGISL